MHLPMRRFALTLLLVILLLIALLLLNANYASAPADDRIEDVTPEATTAVRAVQLVAVTHGAMGLTVLQPEGWHEEDAGVFVSPARDATFVVQRLPQVPRDLIIPVVMATMQIRGQPTLDTIHESEAAHWTIYSTESDDHKEVNFAVGEGATANYLLLVQSPDGQRDAFYEAIFLPALNSFAVVPST